jgi:hypothetical protein
MTDTRKLLADFLATGGKVTTLPAGEAAGASDLHHWALSRAKGNVKATAKPGPRKKKRRRFP